MKDVSIVIINYNTATHTLDCVKSIIDKTSPKIDYEIIVVDNNSEIDDFKKLEDLFPKKENIRLVRSAINTGFGGGNMFGIQFCSRSNYLLILNSDTLFQNDCLDILTKYMDSNAHVGVSTAQNFNEHGQLVPSFDHFKGIRKLLFGRSFLEIQYPKEFPVRKKHYETPVKVNSVNGAFMFFRCEIFEKVGGFDNNIFLYFEEMDICYRMKKLGYSSVLVPEARVLHYQGLSTIMSKSISKEGMISYMYVIRKNYSYLKYLIVKSYYLFSFIVKPKKWFLLAIVFKGAHLSDSLKQQQEIRLLQ